MSDQREAFEKWAGNDGKWPQAQLTIDSSKATYENLPLMHIAKQQAAAVPAGLLRTILEALEDSHDDVSAALGEAQKLVGYPKTDRTYARIKEQLAKHDAAIASVRAAIAATPPAPVLPLSAWRAIETAPKDGTNVLLVNRAGNIAAGMWLVSMSGTGWYLRGGDNKPDSFFNTSYGPTHWQPLPAPPITAPGAVGESGT